MVRTIYVVFTNIRLSDPQVRNMKQYKFLCPYDMVQVGEMQVVGCTQCVNDVQDGIILIVNTCNGVGVYQHNMVQYAGVIYFKNQGDAIKAVKILGESIKDLF